MSAPHEALNPNSPYGALFTPIFDADKESLF